MMGFELTPTLGAGSKVERDMMLKGDDAFGGVVANLRY